MAIDKGVPITEGWVPQDRKYLESNPGHAGRPGQVGGSAPGKGNGKKTNALKIHWQGAPPDDIRDVDVEEEAQDIFANEDISSRKDAYAYADSAFRYVDSGKAEAVNAVYRRILSKFREKGVKIRKANF